MTNPTLSGEPGTFKVQGSIVPTINEYYDLGSTSNRWKDLFLSGNTIHLGTTSLSTDPVTGGLVVATPTSVQPITGGGESVWSQNSTNLYITGSNVGIGKTDPQKPLDVVGDVGVNGTLYITGNVMSIKATSNISSDAQFLGQPLDSAAAPSFSFIANSNTGIFQPAASNIAISTGGIERMRVTANGNVGIGTTNPQGVIHINNTGAMIIPSGTTEQQPSTPLAGMLRYNISLNKIEYFNSFNWISIGSSTVVSGATTTSIGSNTIYTFTTSGSLQVVNGGLVDLLIVAGGGGGGYDRAAGGGAGGLLYFSQININPGSYTVTVGLGGAGATSYTSLSVNGQESSIFGYTSLGGGRGGMQSTNPNTGGSGGGAFKDQSPANGTAGQGFAGGDDYVGTNPTYHAGGGGGAGAVGGTASSTGGGNGGIGKSYSISGSALYYAGGGGGSRAFDVGVTGSSGIGGLGGGGNAGNTAGAAGSPGTPNTGGGGGGGANIPQGPGGQGGSGIIILSCRNGF